MKKFYAANAFRPICNILKKTVNIFFVTFILNFLNCLYAQSFTYFKFEVKDNQPSMYDGLLTIMPDGSSFARIKNAADPIEQATVWEILLSDSIQQAPDKNLYLVDTGITNLRTLTNSGLPYRPIFQFQGLQSSGSLVYSLANIYIVMNGKVSLVANLQKEDFAYLEIKNDLVDDFFSREDPFYAEYFSKPRVPDMAGRGGLSTSDRKRKIHLLIVADLEDVSMGEPCRRDLENMTNTFTNLAKEMKLIPNAPIITYLTEEKFNKKSVLNALNKLKPEKNDIVIFYYTGHGYRDSGDNRSELPKMILGHNYQTLKQLNDISLSMQDVVEMIQKKSSGFNLIINDCCNVEMPAPSVRQDGKQSVLTAKSVPARIYPKNFERLFIKPKGTIVFSSASPKQYSVGNSLIGGFFTWHFRVALAKYLSAPNTNFSWNNIFLEAAKNANWQAKSGECPKKSAIRCVQVPQQFSFLR